MTRVRGHGAWETPAAVLGPATRLILVAALMAGLGAAARAGAPLDPRLDRMSEGRPGDPLPPGWSVRTVRGVSAPDSELVTTAPGAAFERAIRFEAERQAAFFWLELDDPRDPVAGHLAWRWRVDTPVPGASLATPSTDDAPARFFVAFGDGGMFSSPRMIFYSWGGSDEIGGQWTHDENENVRVMVLRNDESPVGTWLREVRNLDADHRAAFGSAPSEPVTAVGFMIDTDATGGRASSALGPIRWLEPEPAGS